MNTFLTLSCAVALFLLAFWLTISGKNKKTRFFTGGLGGLSLLFALNLCAGFTGLKIGLNAITLTFSFLLGVPGVFALAGVYIIL